MSIRLRTVDGILVALCAARSVAKRDDVYLDDAQHHALAQKFAEDFDSEAICIHGSAAQLRGSDQDASRLRAREESNNRNRTRWDRRYGSPSVRKLAEGR